MRYAQTFIDDLRRQADIVRVIQDYVSLKKKGSNWMACCPFHKEKTPSFSVSPAKEIFYCFGCGKGGSVFNFVMEIESVSFPEAIKIVAEKSGVPLPRLVEDKRYDDRRREADDIIQLNTWALEWWEQHLQSGIEDARIARDYLSRREISDETRTTFRLGFSPNSWDALSLHLRQKGATQVQIENSGLVVKKEEGGSYDRFRGRLMFPVFDVQGRPIAFGGRTLKPDEPAKYINSPETSVYVKGRNLFGLNLTRNDIRDKKYAILVEGFLDLIIPYQFGIRNVVAGLGTALTADQVKLLTRFARKVVVNYDGDRAGVQAAKRAIEVLLPEDIDIKILVLPDRADPDEFIRQFGANEYQRRRGEAKSHLQFIIDQAVADRNLHRPVEKAAAVEEVLPYIRSVRSRIQKREYFDIAMDALGIDKDNVNSSAWRRELWHSVRSPEGAKVDIKRSVSRFRAPTPAEQRLLNLLLSNEDLRHAVLPMLNPDDYEDLPTAAIFRAMLELDRQGIDINFESLSEKFADDAEATALLPNVIMNSSLHASNEYYSPEECVYTFRLMKLDQRIEELRSELKMAERDGDSDRVSQIAAEQVSLTRLRSTLRPVTTAAS